MLIVPTEAQNWPHVNAEARPGTRWWWYGSAVDQENLHWQLEQLADCGIGAVEITPVDAIMGNEANNIPYLSDRWMEMFRYVQKEGKRRNVEIDMATGTGWCFGGPWVPLEESACKAVFVHSNFTGHKVEGLDLSVPEKERKNSRLALVMAYSEDLSVDVTSCVTDGRLYWTSSDNTSPEQNWQVIALYVGYGVDRVHRSAPGGEGWVIDHFDSTAVAHHLAHIEEAFERTGTPYPHTFFNDSYEVAAATWTPRLFDEFRKRRGYRLEEHLPELTGRQAITRLCAKPREQVISDYRETLSDLLLENFTMQWTAWAHRHGAVTRNQAHGSPSNLIDCYAAVDIPEIEGFGLSDLGIKGLRTDPGKTRPNDSDYSMFKYAPSAAHICGKPFTSSETFTWLTEHFRTSLSQLKPDLDLMFCAGVNHIFFHGSTYSPKDDPWPGWKFFASIDMSPTNSIWRDAPYFMQYVTRCQSFLQMGQPDNDFLVLLPVRDLWKRNLNQMLMMFTIHKMGNLAPDFIKTILSLDSAGFDCDYISERLLMGVRCVNGKLVTEKGTPYRGLIIPGSGQMPEALQRHIEKLKAQGAYVFRSIEPDELARAARPEKMKSELGLKAIRRRNKTGYHYFIANLSPRDISATVTLAVPFQKAFLFNPLNGDVTPANFNEKGIDLTLRSGESVILQTWDKGKARKPAAQRALLPTAEIPLTGSWTLSFMDEAPRVGRTISLQHLQTWETLPDDSVCVTMGTGIYTKKINLSKEEVQAGQWFLDLGDVRESARVYINGKFIGCAWCVPFILDCQHTLRAGENEFRIEVTNLPANRIRDLDRKHVPWRKMEGRNVVDINYKSTTYDQWDLVPSGLNSEVKLIRF